jgi:hypothetical protein
MRTLEHRGKVACYCTYFCVWHKLEYRRTERKSNAIVQYCEIISMT